MCWRFELYSFENEVFFTGGKKRCQSSVKMFFCVVHQNFVSFFGNAIQQYFVGLQNEHKENHLECYTYALHAFYFNIEEDIHLVHVLQLSLVGIMILFARQLIIYYQKFIGN